MQSLLMFRSGDGLLDIMRGVGGSEHLFRSISLVVHPGLPDFRLFEINKGPFDIRECCGETRNLGNLGSLSVYVSGIFNKQSNRELEILPCLGVQKSPCVAKKRNRLLGWSLTHGEGEN